MKDEYEFGMVYGGEMVDCGEMSRELGISDFFFSSDEGFWWQHREMDYFMPMDERQRMKRFAWRREGISAFWCRDRAEE